VTRRKNRTYDIGHGEKTFETTTIDDCKTIVVWDFDDVVWGVGGM